MQYIFIPLCLIHLITINALPPTVQRKRYDDYHVLRVIPSTNEQLDVLHKLEKQSILKLDFWSSPSVIGVYVDIMIPPESLEIVNSALTGSGMTITVLCLNVQEVVQKELIENTLPGLARVGETFSFSEYQRLSTINNYLDTLALKYPAISSTKIIGESFEKRPLKIIKIGKPKADRSIKPVIWIDGGIHAREWISPATVMFITNKLVTEYNTDVEVKRLVDEIDWYILPVSNPDGYDYTWTNERMWRKTRSNQANAAKPWWCPWCDECKGADPNRNFGHKWMTGGSDSDPCSETYAGTKAFSEPETKAMADFILANKNQIKVYLTFHSYGQVWLTPWGYTSALPTDYKDLESLAKKAVGSLTAVYGTKYRIGTSTNIMYIASGGSDDWAKGAAGIKYSYTIELRDLGAGGFSLPKSQIIPTGQETWQSIKVIGREILTLK